MDYRVEVKPAVLKDGAKYKVIQITDIALHTAEKTPTPSIGKKIQEAFDTGEPGRIYALIERSPLAGNDELTLELARRDPDLIKLVREEEAKGYKVLLSIPKDLPIVAGKDTIEFIKSKNGRRVLRGLAKGKREE